MRRFSVWKVFHEALYGDIGRFTAHAPNSSATFPQLARSDPDLLREKVTRIRGLLDKDSNDIESWFGLGGSLLDLHRPGEAVDALRRVIELDPSHTAAHRDLGRALLESGNPVEAAEVFARAIGLAEKDGDVRTGRDIHVYLRQFEKLP